MYLGEIGSEGIKNMVEEDHYLCCYRSFQGKPAVDIIDRSNFPEFLDNKRSPFMERCPKGKRSLVYSKGPPVMFKITPLTKEQAEEIHEEQIKIAIELGKEERKRQYEELKKEFEK